MTIRHYLLNNIYPTMATATITTAIINTLLPLDDDEFRGAEEKSVTKRRKSFLQLGRS